MKLLAGAALVAFAAAQPALAADLPVKGPVAAPAAAGYFYAYLAGSYVVGGAGSGIENGFDPRLAYPGPGWWLNGYVGYVAPSGWDWRLGAGYAELRAGDSNGAGDPNEYGVDRARMFSLDADVGRMFPGAGGYLRPFVGVRYLNWRQEQGFRPDVPLGCCFMNSTFSGVGPRVGIDGKLALFSSVSAVGGVDVAALFGAIDFTRGITGAQVPPATGSFGRTVVAWGAYAGLELALGANATLGAGYRLLHLTGTSFSNQGFFNPAGPTGSATNLLHGAYVSAGVKF